MFISSKIDLYVPKYYFNHFRYWFYLFPCGISQTFIHYLFIILNNKIQHMKTSQYPDANKKVCTFNRIKEIIKLLHLLTSSGWILMKLYKKVSYVVAIQTSKNANCQNLESFYLNREFSSQLDNVSSSEIFLKTFLVGPCVNSIEFTGF